MAMHVSVKRLQINKANTTIVVAVGVAAFALTFSLVAAKSLIAKQSYQNRVVSAREEARDQLDANIAAVGELKTKYQEFVSRQENIIKGNSTGEGERDGDNARIVLDALPSKYDFPALASSLEKILDDGNYTITSITGIDEEATRNPSTIAGASASATTPAAPTATIGSGTVPAGPVIGTAVEMPFELGASGDYNGVIRLLGTFGLSIRPVKVRSVTLTAGEGSRVEVNVLGVSYFQPERTLSVTEEVVQ